MSLQIVSDEGTPVAVQKSAVNWEWVLCWTGRNRKSEESWMHLTNLVVDKAQQSVQKYKAEDAEEEKKPMCCCVLLKFIS